MLICLFTQGSSLWLWQQLIFRIRRRHRRNWPHHLLAIDFVSNARDERLDHGRGAEEIAQDFTRFIWEAQIEYRRQGRVGEGDQGWESRLAQSWVQQDK